MLSRLRGADLKTVPNGDRYPKTVLLAYPRRRGIHSVITIVGLKNKYPRIQCTLSETLSVLGAISLKWKIDDIARNVDLTGLIRALERRNI